MGLRGKVAIVTGASAGIGRAYALALAGEGATVVAVARQPGESLQESIHAYACDMAVEADVVRLIDHAIANFGRIDVLVNNAATMWQHDPFDMSGERWDQLMATNVRGPYIAIRQAAPHMMKQRSGSIINITAGAGNFTPGSHHPKMLAYSVSKAALNRLTCFMAAELSPHGIAVNSLSPGVVASRSALNLNPNVESAGTHKPCTPEVLGPALLYLAQQTAGTLTGQILHTDEFRKSWPASAA
jgi:NAD(P)-dependent dehydrogenase (short-subunit alcohol dehydrogenase family)